MITQARLKALLTYDPKTGEFVRLTTTSTNARAGDAAGSKDAQGYLSIMLDKRRYKSHRLAWLYVNGEWPLNDIDHIDGARDNNVFANLRDVVRSTNTQNQRSAHSQSKTGLMGASYSYRQKKFRAQISVHKEIKHLGYFDTAEEAHTVYLAAKRVQHAGCTI